MVCGYICAVGYRAGVVGLMRSSLVGDLIGGRLNSECHNFLQDESL
jgi:hypothetical protein